ncbi:MAG: iron export ABC transporter permease subunit FetB [Coriobacteriia bacterium]|nr:iron export ABC transporter permease subunit FetB [Coriobacteriia bacterium]
MSAGQAVAGGVTLIGWPQLLLASSFVVVTGGLALWMRLGVTRDLAIATVRTYVQLLLLGLVLGWVFRFDRWWAVVAILGLMTVTASRIVLKRAPDAPSGLFLTAVTSMAVTGLTVTFAVTGLVIGAEPWYDPRTVIPIAGMVLGNSMTGIALSFERVFADMDARSGEILAMTALGASPWEASHPSIRSALRAGLIPAINAMAAAGIVFIPGMMTGQILAGADPLEATKYQIVVMLMIAAAEMIGALLAVLMSYRRRFDRDGVFMQRSYRELPQPKGTQ